MMKLKVLVPVILLFFFSGCEFLNDNPKKEPEPQVETLNINASDLLAVTGSSTPIQISVTGKLDNGITVPTGKWLYGIFKW